MENSQIPSEQNGGSQGLWGEVNGSYSLMGIKVQLGEMSRLWRTVYTQLRGIIELKICIAISK